MRWVAKAWRSVCGDMRAASMPALSAWRLIRYPERLPRHGTAAGGDEYRVAGAPLEQFETRLGQVTLDPFLRNLAKRHQAFLRTLAEDAHHAHVQAQLEHLERHQLRYPQARGIEQLDHGAVAQAKGGADIRRRKQRLHLGL